MRRVLAISTLVILAGCTVAPVAKEPVILPAQTEGPADTGLFGVVLNKPLGGMGECIARPGIVNRSVLEYNPSNLTDQPCYERLTKNLIGTGAPLGTETVLIRWPLLKGPAISSNSAAGVLLLDGIVHSITINTRGLRTQATDFGTLTSKFGQPSVKEKEMQQNRMGAKYEVLSAGWTRPGSITVTYTGALTRIDSGLLEASTARGEEHRRKALESILNRGPKL